MSDRCEQTHKTFLFDADKHEHICCIHKFGLHKCHIIISSSGITQEVKQITSKLTFTPGYN